MEIAKLHQTFISRAFVPVALRAEQRDAKDAVGMPENIHDDGRELEQNSMLILRPTAKSKLNRLTIALGHSIGCVGNHLEILTLWRGAFTKRHSISSV